jgi:hypothetical protein
MNKYTRQIRVYIFVLFFPILLFPAKSKSVHFKGDYFIYNKDQNYVYGGGGITITAKEYLIKGNTLYLDVKDCKGAIYGGVEITEKTGKRNCDALFFKLFPLSSFCELHGKEIAKKGDAGLTAGFECKSPKDLKSDIFYEFAEFRLFSNQKIRARYIIPYFVGVPSVPLKSLTLKRGEIPDKTEFYLQNLNFSQLDGLGLILALQLQEKYLKGSYDIKLFERQLFKIGGTKRGFIISGQNQLLFGKKPFLDSKLLLNYDDRSFNIDLKHEKDLKTFSYSIRQNISGRQDNPTKYNFVSNFTYKKLKFLTPGLSFTHDLRKSHSYRLSTPIMIWDKLDLNVSWEKRIINDVYKSDNSDFTTTLNFTSKLLTLSSNFNFSKDFINAISQKNFSVNIDFTPIKLLNKNVSFQFAPYALFRTVPMGEEVDTSISKGISLKMASVGIVLPLGFRGIPSYTINQLWDDMGDNTTDFNFLMSIKRTLGVLSFSFDYSLLSRYKPDNFWVEGTNTRNLNVNLALQKEEYFDYQLGFIFDDKLNLQNIRLNGYVNLPWKFKFSSFVLYYTLEERFQSVEIFLEKSFLRKIKLQGGYSLALKKFFIKFLIV